MTLPLHKTKIVATIGPASQTPEMLCSLITAGLRVARVNFSHGAFAQHAGVIAAIREAQRRCGQDVAILADLPGPKMRVGRIDPEPVQLAAGELFILTSEEIVGDARRVSVSVKNLPQKVRQGNRIFLNDGLIQLTVEKVEGSDVRCRVDVGGELRSRKGLNAPGVDLGLGAFTDHDRECLIFALEHGVDLVSQSFVAAASDMEAVRAAAAAQGRHPLLIAKIERAEAIERLEEILKASDGIMVARGDLGVEVPLEEMALLQKRIIARANQLGKPVITATQMLESMVEHRLPTRAEATDVANAILDGTDAVMLSAESAMGKYPVESVTMLAKIAAATENQRPAAFTHAARDLCNHRRGETLAESIAGVVEHALESVPCAAVFVPTHTGATARMISRYKPTVWIAALTKNQEVSRGLLLSYGIFPVCLHEDPEDWKALASAWLRQHQQGGDLAMLVAGPSATHPDASHRIEFIRVR